MDDLRMGVTILGEFIDLDTQTQQRIEEGRRQEKAIREAAKEQVKLAFIDDRKSVEQRAEGERITRASSATDKTKTPQIVHKPRKMPGEGQSLTGQPISPNLQDDDASGHGEDMHDDSESDS
jgi:hypothetical protein